jgi:hypothetical protein
MSFDHPCFVSYRHHGGKLAGHMIEDFASALSGELQTLTGKDAYIDRERLKPGYFYKEHIARNLCRSACMVLFFTPTYFEKEHTYCAREYRAMLALETKRLALLADGGAPPAYGLIIPVVFRGGKYLPTEISNVRQSLSFETYTLIQNELLRQPEFANRVRELAEYIADMWRRLDKLHPDPCLDCNDFKLPTDAEISAWLPEVLPQPQPFPRH